MIRRAFGATYCSSQAQLDIDTDDYCGSFSGNVCEHRGTAEERALEALIACDEAYDGGEWSRGFDRSSGYARLPCESDHAPRCYGRDLGAPYLGGSYTWHPTHCLRQSAQRCATRMALLEIAAAVARIERLDEMASERRLVCTLPGSLVDAYMREVHGYTPQPNEWPRNVRVLAPPTAGAPLG